MQKELDIDQYFMVAFEIDNPKILKEYEKQIRIIDTAGYGKFKYYFGFNFG